MTAQILAAYRPRFLRRSFQREVYRVDGPNGAASIIGALGAPEEFGAPSEAVGYRDSAAKLRCICAYYPMALIILDLRINKHVSSLSPVQAARLTGEKHRVHIGPDLRGELAWNARNFRGEGL